MKINTIVGTPLNSELLQDYFDKLVNHFFKILPMRESNEDSLAVYMKSLRAELLGAQNLIPMLQNDASYLTLLSILQYFIDNPQCSVAEVKRETFKAIHICKKLKLLCSGQNQKEGAL